jgi:hypothetical protein
MVRKSFFPFRFVIWWNTFGFNVLTGEMTGCRDRSSRLIMSYSVEVIKNFTFNEPGCNVGTESVRLAVK